MYICIWRYTVDFAVHYNIHYITFTILVRETWNDYPLFHVRESSTSYVFSNAKVIVLKKKILEF